MTEGRFSLVVVPSANCLSVAQRLLRGPDALRVAVPIVMGAITLAQAQCCTTEQKEGNDVIESSKGEFKRAFQASAT